jgi:hypothetical protein
MTATRVASLGARDKRRVATADGRRRAMETVFPSVAPPPRPTSPRRSSDQAAPGRAGGSRVPRSPQPKSRRCGQIPRADSRSIVYGSTSPHRAKKLIARTDFRSDTSGHRQIDKVHAGHRHCWFSREVRRNRSTSGTAVNNKVSVLSFPVFIGGKDH